MHKDNQDYFDYLDFIQRANKNPRLWETAKEAYLRRAIAQHNSVTNSGELTYCLDTVKRCMEILAEREIFK